MAAAAEQAHGAFKSFITIKLARPATSFGGAIMLFISIDI
jgi:hypothetical protein